MGEASRQTQRVLSYDFVRDRLVRATADAHIDECIGVDRVHCVVAEVLLVGPSYAQVEDERTGRRAELDDAETRERTSGELRGPLAGSERGALCGQRRRKKDYYRQ